jgi:DNA (cytosine-5)-methyltransferase 1
MNSKGGKREGSGRKAIEGKEIKVKLPNEVINEIDDLSEGNTLAEKVRNTIVKSLNKRKNKKLEVLDLFCGAGGLSYGFKLAGFSIVGGVEWDKAAMETHSTNFKSKFEFCGDIKEISDETIIKNLKGVDVIIGGPPCQGFSSANRHEKEKDDPRNKLFFEYLRFIRILHPKVFVIENVKEILTKDNGFAKNRIIEITEELGYSVNVEVLNASDYGVPQVRRRAIFVGIASDLGCKFDFNNLTKVSKPVTVYEAIGDICYPDQNIKNKFLNYAKDTDVLYNHNPKKPNDKVIERMKYVPQGGNWKDVPPELWDTQRHNRHSSAYKRLSFNEPSITIDTGHMNYFHPIFHRVPTVRESARLQSFPDSFIFCGNQGEQYRQVGNAVPPLMAKEIAKEIMRILKEHDTNE